MELVQSNLLTAALEYCERGWSVFPLIGKQPRIDWKDYQTTRASKEQVTAWWTKDPGAGIGLALGPVSGVVRLDADGSVEVPELPATLSFSTPNGRGWLFKYEAGVETEVLVKSGEHEELRLQSTGAYTVIPPSPHPSGGVYAWTGTSPPVELPASLKSRLRESRAGRLIAELERELSSTSDAPAAEVVYEALKFIPAASDYDTWLQVGMALRSLGEDALKVWDDWSKGCPDKYREGACELKWVTFSSNGKLTGRSIIHWAKSFGFVPPKQPSATDIGNSERFLSQHRGDLLHCHPWDKWLVWDGKRWAEDVTGATVSRAKCTARRMLDDARAAYSEAVEKARESDLDDAQGRKKRMQASLAFAMQTQNLGRINAMVNLARSDVPILPAQLDNNNWLLNCTNGVLDLRDLSMCQHRREQRITKLCPTDFCPDACCPTWEKFLVDVFAGKQELIAWLKRFFGYCLTGEVKEHVLPIFWGTGANGKSTLLNTLFEVLGDGYSGKAPSELLLSAKDSSHPTSKATLFGKRLVTVIETREGGKLDETTVKDLTGGDPVSTRRMFEDFWTFQPTHKLVLATNHQPEVRGTDHAIWRRLRLVEFLVTFDGDKQDKELKDKLLVEAPGILRWMVEGCQEWLKKGLSDQNEIAAATDAYRSEQDRIAAFIAANYERREGYKVRVSELVAKYQTWCQQNKEQAMNSTAFCKAVHERGYTRDAERRFYENLMEKQL